MTKSIKYLSGIVFFALISVFFGVIWSRNPDILPYLNFSDETWSSLVALTGYNKFNVEIIVAFFFGALITATLLVAIYVVYLIFLRLTRRSSGR